MTEDDIELLCGYLDVAMRNLLANGREYLPAVEERMSELRGMINEILWESP